ncbi:sigma-70 family RNA polymerase sigma factor [Anaerovoracaceae bacterium 41-7]|uniref:Sigma-70 family RNA polymerase sigma factor n=1 Tax=Anaerotruncus colihominis TaxID=169435 RepID=A0A845QPX3_9FIRM|nr:MULTISPECIES: sigma-70 family RNA polymerase sigma factor [Anaerotruncus]NBH62753.1 sigma-70 family RNA polymerase sigma factor [Anaerotruncus colihominis]NCF03407.1 sigma-70 family RNA polymerase sigma factor [Anaerotruncus sp. 80]
MLDMDAAYKDYANYVFKFLMTLCMEEHTAEELTQETFYQAVRTANKYDGSCKISTWLCQIAKHLWYQELARRQRKSAVPLADLNGEALVSDALTLEQAFSVKDEKMALFRKVHLLSDIEKEVVLLRLTGAFSFKEIGDIVEKTENWARVTFYRAKQKISKE